MAGMTLAGKTAVITGSGRGIGRAIALEFAARGANVVINYFRHRARAEETAHEVEKRGGRALVVKAHVGDEEQVRRLVRSGIAHFGSVDIFIGNAASGVLKPAMEQGAREWDWSMNINARSILFGVQEAFPTMKAHGWGRVIAVSSIGSVRVLPEYSVVGISKAAIEALVRYLAVELAPHGITVNAISPGVVETEALDFFPSKDEIIENAKARTPAGRLVTPEEVARITTWLCSDEAAMIMGQTIVIDGGYALLA